MSRRDQIKLTDQEMRDFLNAHRTIILNSIAPDGVPHPMPMWFVYGEDGSISMTTFTKSQKIKNIERDPRVSLLAEDGEQYEKLRAVVMNGTAELIHDTQKVADILEAITLRTGGAPPEDATSFREGLVKRAEKRTGIRVMPSKIVSWDHRKLGGKY